MDIARIAKTRHATKAFDPARKIPEPILEQLCTLLRYAPSSVNSQPWHFVIAASDAGKARIAQATQGPYAYNEPKVRNASHVVVLCVRTDLDGTHLEALLAAEDQAGRFATPEAKATQHKVRGFYVSQHREEQQDLRIWMEKQVYLALGTLLLGAGALEIDACPMEGFDAAVLDRELELGAQGLASLVLVCLGYRGAEDFNAKLPKARLPEEGLFTRL